MKFLSDLSKEKPDKMGKRTQQKGFAIQMYTFIDKAIKTLTAFFNFTKYCAAKSETARFSAVRNEPFS